MSVHLGSFDMQAITLAWWGAQNIAAGQADSPLIFEGRESRTTNELLAPGPFGLLGAASPVAGLQAVTDAVYLVKAVFTFTLAAPIGAMPIVISSTLYQGFPGDAADSAGRDFEVTTLRAGAAGDRFSHSLAYSDGVAAGDGCWIGITTGSTPIAIDALVGGIAMGYLGPYDPQLAA